jgi:hypothetical protein
MWLYTLGPVFTCRRTQRARGVCREASCCLLVTPRWVARFVRQQVADTGREPWAVGPWPCCAVLLLLFLVTLRPLPLPPLLFSRSLSGMSQPETGQQ